MTPAVMVLAPAGFENWPSATEVVFGLGSVVVGLLVVIGALVVALGLIREVGR